MPVDENLHAHGQTIYSDELDEQFIRSAGPGGQNVNKVSTAVQLRFDITNARGINQRTRDNLIKLAGSRASKLGVITLEASRHRTQLRNREDARERLTELLTRASAPPPPFRRKTKPTRGSVERRLKSKTGRSITKKMRSKPSSDS